MQLELRDPTESRTLLPSGAIFQRPMIQMEVEKFATAGRPWNQAALNGAANCSAMRETGGTVRVVQNSRDLNALLKSQGGWLGDLLTIFDEMGESTCFICLTLALGFRQLKIHEVDHHFTAFRHVKGKLREYGMFVVDFG